MSVIDASAAFECARLGHVPTVRLQPSIFVTTWLCKCARCGRLVEFKIVAGEAVPA